MKYAVILPDGAADEPVPELDGCTPFEIAAVPNIDRIAYEGRQGTVVTVPEGFTAASDVATLSVVGYDPKQFYTGRAPLEAAARKIRLGPRDLVFRCNLVTLADGNMVDHSAGEIRQEEARRIIADLSAVLGTERITFHTGVSYRHLLVIKDATDIKARCTPPHDIPGEPYESYLPAGRGGDLLRTLMVRSQEILAEHEVNQVRRDLGENPASSIWLWGQGGSPKLTRFRERFDVTGTAITAVDLIRGIAVCVGWPLIEVEGATGFGDTNYRGKGSAAVDALDEYDLVAVHIEAPDEAGHKGDAEAKVQAIERIDDFVVGPVLEKLQSFDRWRILVVPDHPTPIVKRIHTSTPPPFCMAGTGVASVLRESFSEAHAANSDLHIAPGHQLMDYFIRSARGG